MDMNHLKRALKEFGKSFLYIALWMLGIFTVILLLSEVLPSIYYIDTIIPIIVGVVLAFLLGENAEKVLESDGDVEYLLEKYLIVRAFFAVVIILCIVGLWVISLPLIRYSFVLLITIGGIVAPLVILTIIGAFMSYRFLTGDADE